MTATESALIRSALPNFVNFMRFLHPGRTCAAKFASSTAELGWDGPLLHCKSQGSVVPSFRQRPTKTVRFVGFRASENSGRVARLNLDLCSGRCCVLDAQL